MDVSLKNPVRVENARFSYAPTTFVGTQTIHRSTAHIMKKKGQVCFHSIVFQKTIHFTHDKVIKKGSKSRREGEDI